METWGWFRLLRMETPGRLSSVETIVAISTPPGRGGIGIVRLAGPEAVAVVARLVRVRRPLEHARVQR
ncbi:MAG: hypothetical protein WBY53_05640, partial [Acidobacteriaceae bacterium]